jgi:hypothetical protein
MAKPLCVKMPMKRTGRAIGVRFYLKGNPISIRPIFPMSMNVRMNVNDLNVLGSIIPLPTVPMMDLFAWIKRAAKHLLGNKAMLANFPTI